MKNENSMKEIIGKYKEENENFSFKLEKFKAETESIEKKKLATMKSIAEIVDAQCDSQ